MNTTDLCNRLKVALKCSALAVGVALIASSGTARATIINSFTGGIANVSGYYSSPGNAQYNAGAEGFTPHVSGSWTGGLDVDYGPPLYFFNNTRFTLTADPGYSVTLQDFDCGQYDGSGLSSFTVLDSADNVLATVSDVATGSMEDFAWPALTDTKLTIVFASTQEDYTWINNIKFSEQATLLQVALTSPADTQGYPTGTSITATASVADPGTFTDTVTFHTTPVNPPGPTVETVSTDTSSPFSVELVALPDGTYEIYATVANDDAPPGTATSATRTFTVAATIPTTTVLASSASPTTYGENVTFTATVSPAPTGGTVQFYDGENYLGIPVPVDPGTGEATYSTTTLGAGSHEISAEYSSHWLHLASTSSAQLRTIDQAQLTVKALNTLRAPNTANPDPFPYQITGYENGENLASSGVTGTPALTTDAILTSPAGDYVITGALGSLAAPNYSFTFVNGTLTVAVVADTFSVNFYAYPGWMTDPEQRANLLVPAGVPAGYDDWFTSGWLNYEVPWGGGLQPAVTLTSNQGSTATFTFKDCRNGWNYSGAPRTTLLGDGNGNMMDGHINSTLQTDDVNNPNKFDMEITGIPFAVYDVIFYMGSNLAQFGDGTGVIVFNGGTERAFTLKPGAFDGTFTEMVDATNQGNYIVFTGVTGSSFTAQTWGTGPNNFNHVGPFGFQVREAGVAPPTATLVIDLGTSPAGTTIEGGTFIGSGPTNLPLPTLPVGSILRSIAVNTKLEATDNENYASDLALLLDPTPGNPGDDFSVEITNGSAPLSVAALNLDWPASADGGVGTVLANTKTDATWAAVGPIDLATTGLFLGNAYRNGTWVSPQGGTWSGIISLTYDLVGTGTKYEDWANGELFDEDKNGDGVKNGLAFLLGAADPDENALGRLPAPSKTATGLKLNFSVLKAADRGDAAAIVQWSNDLGLTDPWSANVAAVPPSTSVVNGVDFQVDSSGALDVIEATIPSTEAVDGKLFGRLSGEEN